MKAEGGINIQDRIEATAIETGWELDMAVPIMNTKEEAINHPETDMATIVTAAGELVVVVGELVAMKVVIASGDTSKTNI